MTTFEALSKESDFIKLDAKRAASLDALVDHHESLNALNVEKPSLRAFQRLEGSIDEDIRLVKAASNAVAAWFTKNGGDNLNDSGYKAYRVKAVKILNELEIDRENYHDILKDKGLLQPPAKPEISADLKDILQSLSETQKQAVAAQTASNKSHKRKELECPRFDPGHCRNNPLAFKSFWLKFEQFVRDCDSDSDKLFWLQGSCKGDAHHLISKFSLNNDNYVTASELLKSLYV